MRPSLGMARGLTSESAPPDIDPRDMIKTRTADGFAHGIPLVIHGDRGVITTFRNRSEKKLARLAKNYEWIAPKRVSAPLSGRENRMRIAFSPLLTGASSQEKHNCPDRPQGTIRRAGPSRSRLSHS